MNFIELERESSHSNYLIQQLIDSGWMGKDVVLVNCSPEYSSRLTQLINHKTSYLNKNELYEQISLEIPRQGMNQVLSYEEGSYISFDRYLSDWITKHITKDAKFLFIQNTVFSAKYFQKIWLSLRRKLDNMDNMKFACLYLQEGSQFAVPIDFYYQKFPQDRPPVFFWENSNLK